MVPDTLHNRTTAWLVGRLRIGLAIFSVVTIVSGLAYYTWDVARIQADKYHDIAAIAQTKVTLIDRWRKEREFDARRFGADAILLNGLDAPRPDAGPAALEARLRGRATLEREVGGYADVYVLGSAGELLVSARAAPGPFAPALLDAIRVARETHRPVLAEPYLAANGEGRIDAVYCAGATSEASPGCVVLSSDAGEFLFPSVQAWPTPSPSAEAFLVRRVGADALFLTDLRFQKGPPLSIRRSMSETRLPAVQALNGVTGEYVGPDYRGRAVLADLRAVPGTSWCLLTKIDADEVFAEVRYRASAITLGVFGLIALGAVVSAYFYRTQQSAERARATAVIVRSERLLQDAQRVASLGHYELDVRTGTWTSSQALEGVFGIDATYPHDVSGWGSLLHPDDRDDTTTYLQNYVVGGGHTFDKEYRIVRVRDGEVRWVHGLGNLKRDDMGRVTHMFGTIQDVTVRKTLEEDLRQRNHEMARFVYTVSHDLKSPIVTIQTFLGFLEEDRKRNDETRVQKDIEFIRNAAERMTALLADLLELSRVGRVSNPPEDIRLQDLVKAAMEMVAGRIARRGATVIVTEEPISLHGDRPRLMELFENLLDNAVKFMGDQPDPRIEIGVERADGQPVIFVRDNGLGIDPRHASRLFGLFEKLHPDTEGTGIGLALVKRIVEVHGGRIWVHSDGPGLGATFRFTIPRGARQTDTEAR